MTRCKRHWPLASRSLLAIWRRIGWCWEPRVEFRELVRIMLDADMEDIGLTPIGEGIKILKEKEFEWMRKM